MNMLKKITQRMCVLLQKENILFWYFVLRFYGEKRNVFHQNVSFLGFNLSIVDGPSFLWQFKEIFVDEIYAFTPLHEAQVIYDCGANTGLSTFYHKKRYPQARVVAFEADSDIAIVLKHNLKRNNVTNVEVVTKAVWVDTKGVSFVSDGADGGSARGVGKAHTVPSVSLREYMEKEEYIDMLMIDIEGAEVAVLRDCEGQLGKVDNLFVEYHSYTQGDQELAEVLAICERSGFRYFVSSLTHRTKPFVERNDDALMDMQVNIFAYRTAKRI